MTSNRDRFGETEAERGSACDSCVVTVFSVNNRDFRGALVDRPLRKFLLDVRKPVLHQISEAPSKNHYLRLEDVDNVANPRG